MLSVVTKPRFSEYDDIDLSRLRIREGKDILSQLKEFGSTLRSIQACVEYSIYKITDALSPLILHDGIQSLPDEILASILEEAVDPKRMQTVSTLALASVNRRFRDVVLRLPGLWSSLPYTRKTKFKLFLERSSDVGITVFLGSGMTQWYRREVLPFSQRWTNVIMRDTMGLGEDLLLLTGDKEKIFCPNLRAMIIDVPFDRYFSAKLDLGSTFIFPALRHLRLSNTTCILPQDVAANLSSFELRYKAPPPGAMVDASRLLNRLSFMHNLQDLSLSFGSIELNTVAGIESSPDCQFPHLIRFNIELSGDTDDNRLKLFLNKLIMTNVRSVCVKATVEVEMQFWITAIFYPGHTWRFSTKHRFPSLEHAVIIVESLHLNRSKDLVSMDDLLEFPHMKTLHIHAPDICSPNPRILATRTLRLRNLTIKGCRSGVHTFLDLLLVHVNPDGTQLCHSLDKLEIIGCPEISRNYLLDHLPVEKIGWSPAVDMN